MIIREDACTNVENSVASFNATLNSCNLSQFFSELLQQDCLHRNLV